MNTHPIAGRAFIFTNWLPGEDEASMPNPDLTIATVIFCVAGPFWLINQFARHTIWKREPFRQQTNQKTKKPAQNQV